MVYIMEVDSSSSRVVETLGRYHHTWHLTRQSTSKTGDSLQQSVHSSIAFSRDFPPNFFGGRRKQDSR
jgi:hypothetical protein